MGFFFSSLSLRSYISHFFFLVTVIFICVCAPRVQCTFCSSTVSPLPMPCVPTLLFFCPSSVSIRVDPFRFRCMRAGIELCKCYQCRVRATFIHIFGVCLHISHYTIADCPFGKCIQLSSSNGIIKFG